MLHGACRSSPAILCVLQLWHSHVPLKENWPCCTARLMEGPGDQCSLSRWKWTQTIGRYPTAFRKRVSLKEQSSVGLLAFPLPTHVALCMVSERWIVSTSTWITLKYWTAASPVLRQFPGRPMAGWTLSTVLCRAQSDPACRANNNEICHFSVK